MKRIVTRRTILPAGIEFGTSSHTIDLAMVAHAAAVETLQVALVAKGWVGMFGALLEPGSDTSPLVWSANGPGGEAEIKRAYSGLFGRFFGRAVLRHEHGCIGLRQVRDGMQLASGVTLQRRVPGLKGDLPDWVAWNPAKGCFSICEAKGSYAKASWAGKHPPILKAAGDQLDRVHVIDTGGRLQTKDWVVASRWGTAVSGKPTTIITKDPLTEGRPLSPAEAARISREAYSLWFADLLDGIGRPALAAKLRGDGGLPAGDAEGDIAEIAGRAVYAAIAIDGLGVIPLRGARRRDRLELFRGVAADADAKVALVGIDAAAVRSAAAREWIPDEQPEAVGVAGSVFSDGVLLTWDVDSISL